MRVRTITAPSDNAAGAKLPVVIEISEPTCPRCRIGEPVSLEEPGIKSAVVALRKMCTRLPRISKPTMGLSLGKMHALLFGLTPRDEMLPFTIQCVQPPYNVARGGQHFMELRVTDGISLKTVRLLRARVTC